MEQTEYDKGYLAALDEIRETFRGWAVIVENELEEELNKLENVITKDGN